MTLVLAALMLVSVMGGCGAGSVVSPVAVTKVCAETQGQCWQANATAAFNNLLIDVASSVTVHIQQQAADETQAEVTRAQDNNLNRKAFLCQLNDGPLLPCSSDPAIPGAFITSVLLAFFEGPTLFERLFSLPSSLSPLSFTERDRDRQRQTDRQRRTETDRDRQTETETNRQTDQTDRQRQRETEKEREREREGERETETET